MERERLPSKAIQGIGLAGWLGLCYAASAVGSRFTDTGPWFQALRKPSFYPPDWLFGPVWGVLYGLMAVAAWLVWRKRGFSRASAPLGLFGVQLALNVAWSYLFFGARNPPAAFAEILVLWAAILATLVSFLRVSRAAGYLLVPYLAWVTFAAALNFSIWRLNG